MLSRQPQSFAFVLKFPADADPRARAFEGRIEHVASGRPVQFSMVDELLKFIAGMLSNLQTDDAEQGLDSVGVSHTEAGRRIELPRPKNGRSGRFRLSAD